MHNFPFHLSIQGIASTRMHRKTFVSCFYYYYGFFPLLLFFFSHSAEYCISDTPYVPYSITPNREYYYAYEFLVWITWLAIERKSHRLNKVKFKCRGWYFFLRLLFLVFMFEMDQLTFQWGRKYKSATQYLFFRCDQWQQKKKTNS